MIGGIGARGAYLSWGSPANSLYWDCIIKESALNPAKVTRHPVEFGISITDHVRPEPKQFTLQGYISQTPIRSGNTLFLPKQETVNLSLPPSQTAPGGAQSASYTLQPLQAQTPTDLVQAMIEVLQGLQDSATLVSVVAPNLTYDNMIIETFEVSGEATTGLGRMFDVTLSEIRTVQSLTIAAPVPAIPRVQQKQATGNQPTMPAGSGIVSAPAKLVDAILGSLAK